MYSIFGFDVSVDVLVAILVVNTTLLAAAIIGFTNLKRQIRELKELLNKIKEKQKAIK